MARKDLYEIGQWTEFARRAQFRPNLLANALGISHRQLQRYARELFGCSLQKWLKLQRLQHAGYLLVKYGCAKTVCHCLGFKRLSHFSREFKRHYGRSPAGFLAWTNRRIPSNKKLRKSSKKHN
jgi:AraC-like DNA-binding protein